MSDNNESSPVLNSLNVLLLMVALLLPLELLQAWACGHLWQWFLAPQYGAGPSLMGWLGAGLVFTLLSTRPKSKKDAEPVTIARVLKGAALRAVWILVVLGFAWVLRAVAWGAP